jgi:hypothetical protein
MGLPAISFADPIGKMAVVFLDDLCTAIGAAAINDDVFDIPVVLAEDRIDGGFNIVRLIIIRRYDTDLWTMFRSAEEEPSSLGHMINSPLVGHRYQTA